MTGALIRLQVLCFLIFGLAALGVVICTGLTYWAPVLGLGRPD